MQGFEHRIPRGQAEHCIGHVKDVTSPAQALLPPTHVLRIYTNNVVKLLKTRHSIQYVLHFDPA